MKPATAVVVAPEAVAVKAAATAAVMAVAPAAPAVVATAAEVTVVAVATVAVVPAVVTATAVAVPAVDTAATVDTVVITTTNAETAATNLERARDRGPSSRVEKPTRRRLAAAVVWGTLLFGGAGSVVALGSRGGAEVFQYEQSSRSSAGGSGQVSAAHVAAVVAQAPEPVTPARRTHPAQVRCQPGGGAVLRNPWSCSIVYRDGTRAHYLVTVEPDGHYRGTGTGIITGCCVETPALD